jgi:hypothetical protein
VGHEAPGAAADARAQAVFAVFSPLVQLSAWTVTGGASAVALAGSAMVAARPTASAPVAAAVRRRFANWIMMSLSFFAVVWPRTSGAP